MKWQRHYQYNSVKNSSTTENKGDNHVSRAVSLFAASRVIDRSRAIAVAKLKKNNIKNKTKVYCKFYCRFGKCHRGDKCTFVHDPKKVGN